MAKLFRACAGVCGGHVAGETPLPCAKWPSKRGPISKIRPSDGCGKNAVPLAVVRRYDFPEIGGYLGNVGLICVAQVAHGEDPKVLPPWDGPQQVAGFKQAL